MKESLDYMKNVLDSDLVATLEPLSQIVGEKLCEGMNSLEEGTCHHAPELDIKVGADSVKAMEYRTNFEDCKESSKSMRGIARCVVEETWEFGKELGELPSQKDVKDLDKEADISRQDINDFVANTVAVAKEEAKNQVKEREAQIILSE